MTPARIRFLQRLLWLVGTVDLIACLVVVLPFDAIDWLHKTAGMGQFPNHPIAGYLARNTSALVAIHGIILLMLAHDVIRYRALIRGIGLVSIIHGAILVGIDFAQEVPFWWTLVEGPTLALIGVLMVYLTQAKK